MYDLHIPILGLSEIKNKNFFNLIDVYVYFHKASKAQLEIFYSTAKDIAGENIDKLNRERNSLSNYEYQNRIDYWTLKKRRLNRDVNMSICIDTVEVLVRKISKMTRHVLFTDDIYDDFKRRLLPPEFVKNQAVKIKFDKHQYPLTVSAEGLSKVKGVAGCGKTTILAQRAINALSRHHSQILILTYNITIRHYIRDTISRLYGEKVAQEIEIIHYHAFIKAKMNEHNISFVEKMEKFRGSEQERINKVFSDQTLFENIELNKYKTILLDEVQDYEPEWIKIIRDNFLEENGEMLIFGDQSQNIYERDDRKRESSLVHGFGRWNKLTKSFRSDINTPLVKLFSEFQKEFLVSKYKDCEVFESSFTQSGFDFEQEVLIHKTIPDDIDGKEVASLIISCMKKYSLHPNDVVIIASHVEPLLEIDVEISKIEKTKIMFENLEEVEYLKKINKFNRDEIEKIRRRKKSFFYQNSGLIKISTTHSFKGLEAETAFLIIQPKDSSEIVYTGMTRAKKNLVVFSCASSSFQTFFKSNIE